MRTEDIDGKRPSAWIPVSEPRVLAALGKLAEEVNELGAIIARSIIQGTRGTNPETGELNIEALEKEIADVRGLSALVIRQFGLDESAIAERAEKKRQMKYDWIQML
jgi:hypothetical protein